MMNFRNIIRCILCISLFITVPTPNANAQVGQAVKSVSKTVGKWFGEKAAKEGAEEVIEQSAKTISKEMAQKVIVKNSAAAIVNPASKFSRNALTDFTSANIKRTMMSKIGSEISESALKATSKEFAQQIGKSSSKEAQELFVNRLGSESSQEIYELSTKQAIHRKAFEAKKSWPEKLKDKYHTLKLTLLQKIHKSKIYKELLDIYTKGPISLTEKEMMELLAHPEYFRAYLKAKIGKKGNVIEFLIRLKLSNPQYVKQILNNPSLLEYIKKSVRGNKGVHEWLMVKNIEDFLLNPKWDPNGDFLALSLCRLTQKTDNVLFKVGGKHGSTNSTKFHNGLSKVIEQSSSIEELFVNVRRYAKQNLTSDAYNEFLKIFESVFEAA